MEVGGTGQLEQIQNGSLSAIHLMFYSLTGLGSQGPPCCITRLGYQNATLPLRQPSPTKARGDEPAHAPSATKKGMFAAQFEVEEQAWLLG